MSDPNRIHLLPERDRMMAETYEQNADGSANPTGRAEPEPVPMVYRGPQVYRPEEQGEVELGGGKEDASEPVGKVVEPPASPSPKGSSTASTKARKAAAKKA